MVFRIIGEIVKRGETADFTTVKTQLEQSEQFHGSVAKTYTHIGDELASFHAFDTYLSGVVGSALKRRLMVVCDRLDEVAQSTDSVEEVLTKISKYQSELEEFATNSTSRKKVIEVSEAVTDYLRSLEEDEPNEIPTGFYAIDDLIVGLSPGALYIIAGRPGLGKSSLALNIARNVAERGIKVGLISLEMGCDEVALRLLSDVADVPGDKMRKRVLEEEDLKDLAFAREHIRSNMNIYINDAGESKMDALVARIKSMVIKEKLGIIILDYLQLMESTGTRWEEVSKMSRSLKMLAKDLKIPVVALSQLNREVEKRPKGIPMLADLRESGSIEQDANVVMLLHRPNYYKDQEAKGGQVSPVESVVIIAKNRSGARGWAHLLWDGRFTRFENVISQAGMGTAPFLDPDDPEVHETSPEEFDSALESGRGDGSGVPDVAEPPDGGHLDEARAVGEGQ